MILPNTNPALYLLNYKKVWFNSCYKKLKSTVLPKLRDYLHRKVFLLLKNILRLSATNMQNTKLQFNVFRTIYAQCGAFCNLENCFSVNY